DRRKLNFTVICHLKSEEQNIFPNDLPLGSRRPSENNIYNLLSIRWLNLSLVSHPESNIYFLEHRCFSTKLDYQYVVYEPTLKTFNISKKYLHFNGTFSFTLITRSLDGRMLISQKLVDKRDEFIISDDLNLLDEVMNNLDNLVLVNPKKAVQLITDLAEKLNEMSENSTNNTEIDLSIMNERMTLMRLKMLSSMDVVLDVISDPISVIKAVKASTTVTANSDQMPLNNQEKGAGLIEKVGNKVRDMELVDDNTITVLATSLMDTGGNVLYATSKTVQKNIEKDPETVKEELESTIEASKSEDNDQKVLFAPTEFYSTCDECETLPEERWEMYRTQLDEQNHQIIDDRQRASHLAKRSSSGLFIVGDVLANRTSDNDSKSIEGKSMSMAFTKQSPDGLNVITTPMHLHYKQILIYAGKSSLSAGDTQIKLPALTDMLANSSSDVVTKVLSSKNNPYASTTGNSTVEGSVVTIILTNNNGTEIPVQNTSKPISLFLTRPQNKMPDIQEHELYNLNMKYHKAILLDKYMALSVYIKPSSSIDSYVLYVSYGNDTVEPPTDSKFDFIYTLPNNNSISANYNNCEELKYTIFMPPSVHYGNGTYIFGVRLNRLVNITDQMKYSYNSSYIVSIYASGCQYWDEQRLVWSKEGCQIGSQTTMKSTECLCTHLTTFGSDFYVPPNTINFKTVWANFKKLHENAAVFVTVIGILGLYIIAAIWARKKDKKDIIKDAGTTSNVSFIISGETADSGVRKLSDGKQKVSGFQYQLTANPMESYFICDNWLAVEKSDGMVDRVVPVASTTELKSFTHLFTQSVKKKFSDGHLWFSVFSRPVRSNFTRLQRISCCISLLFCTMISNAMFYKTENKSEKGFILQLGPLRFTLTQLWISFIGTLIVLPVNLIIVTLFRKAGNNQQTLTTRPNSNNLLSLENKDDHYFSTENRRSNFITHLKARFCHRSSVVQRQRLDDTRNKIEDKERTLPHWAIYIAWTLVILSILTCSFFIILYSMEWGRSRSNEWLSTMMLSFGQSVLIIDPLKVFIATAIISFLIRKPYDDETMDFNDPFAETLINTEDDFSFSQISTKEIARQRRVRLFELKPINHMEMKQARELRLKEIKMSEIIREVLIYCLFTTILLFLSYQARDIHSNGLFRDTKNLFITKDYNNIKSVTDWWNYCDNTFLKGLYAQTWYNGKTLSWREKLTTGSRTSMRVGAARIRQLRVKENSCRVHRRVRNVIFHCRDDYSWWDDDTKNYKTGWNGLLNGTFVNNDNSTKRCKTPWCYQNSARTKSGPLSAVYSTYKGGGYLFTLGRTYEKARILLEELKEQKWLDQLTRALVIDFSLYNANVNLFVSITLSLEFTSMGSVINDYKIKVFRLYDHLGGYAIIVLIFEIFFCIFTIYALTHEILLIIKQKKLYFKKFWNLHGFITVAFSITAIGMYGTKKAITRLAIRSLRKTEMGEFVNFNAIATFDEVYSYIVGLITFFTMLKFLKLLRFNKRIGMLSATLRYARRDLNSFAFVFMIFILAYAQFGFALFGRSLRSFKSLFTSLTTCFRMMLGEINAEEMVSLSKLYGTFYFISFLILVFIALLGIFLTILNDSFAHIKHEMAKNKNKNDMLDFMWSTFKKVAGLNRHEDMDKKELVELEKNRQIKEALKVTIVNDPQVLQVAPLAFFNDL
ncbi:unnamed protein product, partial [Didymodactylos carnosus]